MSDNHIEILGQKLSYPDNVHGVTSVFFVCFSLVLVSYIFTKWVTPEKALSLMNYASIQETKVNELARSNQILLDQIGDLEKKLKWAVSNRQAGGQDIKKIKSQVSDLQRQRKDLYSTLDQTFKAQDTIVDSLSKEIGGQQQVQIIQQQQLQQDQIKQQIEQQNQQQRQLTW